MYGLATISVLGRLGADPELREVTVTRDGMPTAISVVSFPIAVNYKKQSGEEVTEWFTAEAWGRRAEILAKYLSKGRVIYVTGTPKVDTWFDKRSGEPRARIVVKIEKFSFIDSSAGSSARNTNDYGPEMDVESIADAILG